METVDLAERWRSTWQRAWEAKDSAAIAALYAGGAVYRSHPFREPESSARDYAEREFALEDSIVCRFGEPLVSARRAAVEWWATFEEGGEQVTLIGVTVLRFGDDGLVVQHTDYWADAAGRVEPFPGWA
jgi:hypothetical protein